MKVPYQTVMMRVLWSDCHYRGIQQRLETVVHECEIIVMMTVAYLRSFRSTMNAICIGWSET
jgi:hypothetical protein